MRKMTMLPLALTILAGSAACSNTKSTDVATDALYADLSVTADGTGSTHAHAALRVGGATSNDFLDLQGGDALVASAGTLAQTMTRGELLGAVFYDSTLAIDDTATQFTIAFNRVPGNGSLSVGAPDSHVNLPNSFAITAPAAGGTFHRSTDPITVTWDGSGQADPMNWALSGDCIQLQSQTIPADSGTLTIAAGSIVAADGQAANSCQLTLTVRRSRAGVLDTAYGKGGSMVGAQVRTLQFLSAP